MLDHSKTPPFMDLILDGYGYLDNNLCCREGSTYLFLFLHGDWLVDHKGHNDDFLGQKSSRMTISEAGSRAGGS